MKILTDEQLNLPRGKQREWYVADDENRVLAGPYAWFGTANEKKKQIEASNERRTN